MEALLRGARVMPDTPDKLRRWRGPGMNKIDVDDLPTV